MYTAKVMIVTHRAQINVRLDLHIFRNVSLNINTCKDAGPLDMEYFLQIQFPPR